MNFLTRRLFTLPFIIGAIVLALFNIYFLFNLVFIGQFIAQSLQYVDRQADMQAALMDPSFIATALVIVVANAAFLTLLMRRSRRVVQAQASSGRASGPVTVLTPGWIATWAVLLLLNAAMVVAIVTLAAGGGALFGQGYDLGLALVTAGYFLSVPWLVLTAGNVVALVLFARRAVKVRRAAGMGGGWLVATLYSLAGAMLVATLAAVLFVGSTLMVGGVKRDGAIQTATPVPYPAGMDNYEPQGDGADIQFRGPIQ